MLVWTSSIGLKAFTIANECIRRSAIERLSTKNAASWLRRLVYAESRRGQLELRIRWYSGNWREQQDAQRSRRNRSGAGDRGRDRRRAWRHPDGGQQPVRRRHLRPAASAAAGEGLTQVLPGRHSWGPAGRMGPKACLSRNAPCRTRTGRADWLARWRSLALNLRPRAFSVPRTLRAPARPAAARRFRVPERGTAPGRRGSPHQARTTCGC